MSMFLDVADAFGGTALNLVEVWSQQYLLLASVPEDPLFNCEQIAAWDA